MSWGLVWFRNDLRVRDHEALLTACLEHAGRIIPVYVFDKRQVGPHARTRLGQFSKCSTPRAQFLVEAVQDLANTLRTHYRGMQLLVYKNALPENVIPKLIAELSTEKQVHVGAVYYHREVCSEERAVEDALRAALCALNQRGELPAVTLRALDGSYRQERPWGTCRQFSPAGANSSRKALVSEHRCPCRIPRRCSRCPSRWTVTPYRPVLAK
jgi:deoxyribodipyrimidine photolyase